MQLDENKWSEFTRACESQWKLGGKRYALDEDKEFTDLVCEVAGNQWIGGNIIKYSGEIENYKKFDGIVPEVNFFKIAVYSYIWWLKEFKHPTTGIRLKEMYWKEFVETSKNYALNFRSKDSHGSDDFIDSVRILIQSRRPTELSFFFIVIDSFNWWLSEHGSFTKRDEGEEFSK